MGYPALAPDIAQLGLPRYQAVLNEEETELEGVALSDADHLFFHVYGDHYHKNYGHRMYRGIYYNEACQFLWWILVRHTLLR